MQTSILHLSDLHRDPDEPLGNGPLLESLKSDLRRYTTARKSIRPPELAVVSGDLVQGIPHDGSLDRLREQYEQAEEFLSELSDIVCRGNRERIVIVPGNHDVAFPTFAKSLAEADDSPKNWPAHRERLLQRGSNLRWSWRERKLYEIEDLDLYARRLEVFAEFYERFYEGKREYSLDPAEQFEVFDFPDLEITIVGFSSCYRNDPFNTAGDIHPDALAAAGRMVRGPQFSRRLLFAVWHHSISAPPPRVDFMDEERVQILLDYGFTLGFHGHHHRPEQITDRSRFGQLGKITVISAGTLCGGERSLPPGRARGYNVVEIDRENRVGKLHVRRMRNDNLDHPLWGSDIIGDDAPHCEFDLAVLERFAPDEKQMLKVSRAEDLQREGKHEEAAAILQDVAVANDIARRLLLKSLGELEDAKRIAQNFDPPVSDDERIYLMEALWDLRETERLADLLESAGISDSESPQVRAVRDRCRQRIAQ